MSAGDHTSVATSIGGTPFFSSLLEQMDKAAEELLLAFGEEGFAEAFQRAFNTNHGTVSPIVTLLGRVARGCIVTTNFDRLVERQLSIHDVYNGRRCRNFHRALADGSPALLKLHGDLADSENRVLTQSEYDLAYGGDLAANTLGSIPDALGRIFSHYRLLFVGCSLGPDRTMGVFRSLVEQGGESRFPRHFAVIEATDDMTKLDERERFLNERMIFPIWYPSGCHSNVGSILENLIGDGE